MAASNNHTAAPFHNSNANHINGITPPGTVLNNHPSILPPFFMNASTHLPAVQNTHPSSSFMHAAGPSVPAGQCHGGFAPQQCAPNVNLMVQNLNMTSQFQSRGQLFMPNLINPTQNFNPNANIPTGPFCFGNPMQNTSHLLSMQVNNAQLHPYNAHSGNQIFGLPNQVAQSACPQNFPVVANPSFLVQSSGSGQHANQNQHSYSQGFPCNCPSSLNHTSYHSTAPQNSESIPNPLSMVHSSGVRPCISNHGQVFPWNAPHNLPPTSGHSNQVPQSIVPQNAGITATPFITPQNIEVGLHMDQHQNNLSACQMHMNALNRPPVFVQNQQGSSLPSFCAIRPQQTNNKLQPFPGSQVNETINNGGANFPDSISKNSPTKNFARNPQSGKKSHIYNKQNIKGRFGFHDRNGHKGPSNNKAGKYQHADIASQIRREPRRSVCLKYTEQEIQQWKEERRKNYPSKVNLEKKKAESGAIHEDAERRRQQLKEILAKQAELGVEIAEIPAAYLCAERGRNGGWSYKKRGRREVENEGFGRRSKQREMTLLQKLVRGDVKRDGRRLLQAFRFMLANDFFQGWPDKPLKFPSLVVAPESGEEGEIIE